MAETIPYDGGNDPQGEANLRSIVKAGVADAKNRRDAIRSRIHDAFPAQGTEQPVSSGSQSTAPNSPTTPGRNE